MLVTNPNFRSGLYDGLYALRGLKGIGRVGLGDNDDNISPFYSAPSLTPYENCQPEFGVPSSACVDRNGVTQQGNFAKSLSANRAAYIQQCNDNWIRNDQQFRALGLPSPANTCEGGSYGQVFSDSGPASYSGVVSLTDLNPAVAASNARVQQIQAQQMNNPNPTPAIPQPHSPASQAQSMQDALAPLPRSGSSGGSALPPTTAVTVSNSNGGFLSLPSDDEGGLSLPNMPQSFSEPINIWGNQVPAWMLGAAALAAIFVFGGSGK
jgi:hypothetical protein